MSIYVGLSFPTPNKCKWPYKKAAHLLADTIDELHGFAQNKLYLKREWFQPKSSPHYDLTASKRLLAIKLGAIPFQSVAEEGRFLLNKKTQFARK